ncbi:hypothetical protein [Streptomyces sp. NPDC048340]|uniref:hypothetical protein n=1 Tax=Streptomyces sp. NPDC048340 TaxID=3365537 RepID=UPI00371754C2
MIGGRRGAAESFGSVHAVAGVDLDVRRGETVALLGIGNGYRLPGWMCSLAERTPTRRFAEIGQSFATGAAPGLAAFVVVAVWVLLFGSYGVLSYRRSARAA